jgi:hypothetical protein
MEKEEVFKIISADVCKDTTLPDYAFRAGAATYTENMSEHEQKDGVELLADGNARDSLEVKTNSCSTRVKCW